MNFLEFINVFGNNPVIDIRNVETYFNGIDRRRLFEWQKKGYILKITNNFYVASSVTHDDGVLRTIASQIYQPSYIALESALSFYNFIPEAVFKIVCITTRRNKNIKTKIGDFSYHSIKPALFFGYNAIEAGNRHFFISDPEKTLLDFLYFYPGSNQKNTLKEMRFNFEQIKKTINEQKLADYLKLFSSPKLNQGIKYLKGMINA